MTLRRRRRVTRRRNHQTRRRRQHETYFVYRRRDHPCLILLAVGCSALVASSVDDANVAAASDAVADTTPEGTSETAGQENARRSAASYLDHSAFSRQGLIEQLSSEYGEGFSKADAIYAVNHIDVDWNEQAAKSAKSYLDHGAFSRQGLIEQLSSEYGEGFTHAQAVYGVNQTGL
jgi:hypothetical protein